MSGCKYYKQKRQVSYDNGSTWQDVVPAVYQKGALIEADSADCGYIVVERFVVVTGEYMCDGTTKYQKMKKQNSYDGGSTWQDVVPAVYQKGALIEAESIDCGYVFDGKFKATYSNGRTYSAECDSSTDLTSATTKPSGYQYTAMTTAEIGDCITSIDYGAFSECYSLTSITIPDSVTSIGIQAFFACRSLTSITIPDSVTSIGYTAFIFCSGLTGITIPDSVASIGDWAFSYCSSLTSITIPDSVTSIGFSAFGWCSGLTSVTIGTGVTSIGEDAFQYCRSLTSITINAITPPTLGTSVFIHTNNCTIYVPCNSLNAYKTASGWSEYADRIREIPGSC